MARVTSPVLIGRVEELAFLMAAVEQVAVEGARVVLLGGEAGVGKTRLVREFAGASADARFLIGGSFGVGGPSVPYAPVTEALRRLLRQTEVARWPALLGWTRTELAILLPETAASGRPTSEEIGAMGQGRLFGAILGLLDRLARDRPTVLVLEDIHWADRSTLDLVAYLAHGLDRERVLLLLTFRTDESTAPTRSLIARLEHRERVDRIDLGPLDPAEVLRLVEAIQGHQPDRVLVDDVVARSEGNPFFVEELVAARTGRVEVPRALREVLELRLEAVPRRAMRLLDVASVAGMAVDEGLLRHVSGFSKSAVEAALHESLDHGLLVRSESRSRGFELRHALMAETLRARMLADERRDLHRAIATWLQKRVGSSDTPDAGVVGAVAHHWDEARDPGKALPWLIRAGAAAEATYAWAEAEGHYSRALALWDEAPAATVGVDRATTAGRAAEAAFYSGRYDRAAELARTAISLLDPEGDALQAGRQYARLAYFLMWTREPDQAAEAADRAVKLVPEHPPSRERAEALSSRATTHQAALRHRQAMEDASGALAMARMVGDPVTEGRALSVLGVLQLREGSLDEGRQSLDESRRIALESGRFHDAARADYYLGAGLANANRFEEALGYSQRGVELSLRSGLDRAIGDAIQYWRAYSLMRLGRTDEAEAAIRDALATTRDIVQERECRAMYGWILLRAGKLDEADEQLTMRWPVSEHHPADTGRFLLARAEADLVRGRYRQAVAIARRAETDLDPELHSAAAALAVAGIAAAAASEEPQLAAGFAARLRAVAARCQRHHPIACRTVTPLWQRLGATELDRSSGRPAARRWQAIVEGLRDLSEPYWLAYVLYRLAEALARSNGRRTDAAAALAEARSIAGSMGAATLVADLDALARRARIQVGEPAAPPSGTTPSGMARRGPQRDPLALTARELEVLGYLAEGLSDGEIAARLHIAKATASVHVMNIKQKLGAESRVEAVVRAIRDGLVAVPPK